MYGLLSFIIFECLSNLVKILGMEVAGEVVEVGPGVTRFKKGSRVIAYVNLRMWVIITVLTNHFIVLPLQ